MCLSLLFFAQTAAAGVLCRFVLCLTGWTVTDMTSSHNVGRTQGQLLCVSAYAHHNCHEQPHVCCCLCGCWPNKMLPGAVC